MRLYEKDFKKPNDEEKRALKEYKEFYSGSVDFSKQSDPIKKYNTSIQKYVYHALSKFPNNVFFSEGFDKKKAKIELDSFSKILDSSQKENDIQTYIKDNRKWFIPASIIKEYNFGHKENYLFPEIEFGKSYKCDYLICGRNSDGYNLLFIEFENANVNFVNSDDNCVSHSVNSGMGQIQNWKLWLSENRQTFLYEHGFTERNISVPLNRIFFCLVVGRRERMEIQDRNRKNQLMYDNPNLKIINYDRVLDYMSQLNHGYCGMLSDDFLDFVSKRNCDSKSLR